MSRLWNIKPVWRGETCAILASGPSMNVSVARTLEGRCRVIAINDNYKLAPWADILYAADHPWWREYPEALKFAGRKVTINAGLEFAEVEYIESGGYADFDHRTTHVRTGKNGGYQAIHIAAHLGVRRIILCGFNMRSIDGLSHWFGDHPPNLHRTPPYETWISLFARLAPLLRHKNIEVINCTPKSALNCFEKQSLETALESVSVDTRSTAISA